MRALGRWTPLLVLLFGALLLEPLLASKAPSDRRKRQAKPFDDEVLEQRVDVPQPTPNRTPDPRPRPDPYRHQRYHDSRHDPRQDPRQDARQRYAERTPPPRRHETPRYDPRTEARRRIFTEFDELGEEKGNWTEWDDSAPCSRTCGGGVTFKKRTCLEEPCVGPTRIYSTCNKQDCPKNETQEDFLLRQCQRMNSVPHEGRYYSWIVRRRHDRNPCELNCSPRDRDLELRARHNVIDGTRCYHAGFDQCVDGQCVPTGCDGLLGSRKRIDKCLVCGGENKNCNTTVHSENRVQLPTGYVPILVIPKGATSIMVRESHVTRNYISLRDLNGTSYLNKLYEIDSSKAFIAGGARFHYTRNQQYMNGREFLRADGPTNETLVVVLLVQEMNRGFEIEFSLKEVPGQPRPRSGEFQWQKGEWDPCTDPCGERNTTRSVRCASIITNLDAPNVEECDAAEEPPSMKSCPVDNCQSEWYTGAWERCSNTCGNGTQTRAVFCSTAAGEGVRVLPDRLCKEKGDRPPSEQECSSNESCDKWEVGEWGESERKCGVTKVTREVYCTRQMENSTEGVDLDADCLEDLKPEAEKEVFLEPCNGVEWAMSEWTPCVECGSAVQTRSVECVNEEGRIYDESFCAGKPKPETVQPCAEVPPCEYRWWTSEWSPCSSTCGIGYQSRIVFCLSYQNSTCPDIVDDSNCKGERPADQQLCNGPPCESLWLSAPWNKQCPENACGGVPRKRFTFCYKDGVVSKDCPEDEKPSETDDCSPQACPADSINVLGECVSTEHGCCPDGTSVAGAEFTGCPAFERENFTTPCAETEFGCCRDLVTPAFGPFDAGCSLFALCNGTEYGCCQDGETRAEGPNFQGCVVPCDKTLFGCCPDGETAAPEEDQVTGCPEVTTAAPVEEEDITTLVAVLTEEDGSEGSGGSGDGEIEGSGGEPIEPNCADSEHGCCPDNVTPAKDAEKRKGCVHCRAHKYGCCPDGVTAALGRKFKGCEDVCTNSTFGCCPDGFFPAKGPSKEGCEPVDCKNSKYGCCGKLKIPAAGPQKEGCGNCTESVYGCCANNEDFALGLNSAGCCADSPFGCCPDNITLAQGPDLAGCPCSTLKYGCCPDKVTPALGPKQYGCTCENSEFGCCPDLITPALGPGRANCTCDRTAFGCCPDGVTAALGPDARKSCDCRTSQFGCCPDGRTAATGQSHRGCYCNSMKYGCCPDNHTPAAGPNYLGCPCQSTHYGCCPDGETKKLGPRNEGCEDCTKLKYGCCPDGDHAARGPDFQGCPCESTEFGCCPDRVTPSKGKDNEGCPAVPCHRTQYGCCPDGTAAKGRDYEGCNLTEEERRRIEERRRGMDTRRRPGDYAPPTKPPYYEPKRTRDACFQSEDRGPCGNWTLNFYYDSQNATCRMFYYGGCGGNDNRFPDNETCMSLCRSDIAAPKIDYVPPIDTNEVVVPRRRTERYPCDLPKDSGPCSSKEERYWYNQATNQCERFLYGCQGNDNRFFTHKACSDRCKVLSVTEKCTLPKAIGRNCTDPQYLFRYDYKTHSCETYKGCTEDVNVFRDYNKCVSTCQDMRRYGRMEISVCNLPLDPGPCIDYQTAWGLKDGKCIQFIYGGCEGNANRFRSKEECEATCQSQVPPIGRVDHGGTSSRTPSSVHLCEQPREVGPCQNFETRYYYDSSARTCFAFNYGGCGGNMNNFMSNEDCQRQCAYRHGGLTPQQPRSSTFNVRDCQLPKDRGTCTGSSGMFYYNPNDGVCREFTYSGCGGNNNRFTTRHECERSCKNAQNRCQLPTIKGRCGGVYKMWTYDAQKDICKQFDYSGCHGNANRFDSKAECEKSCVRNTYEVTGISSEFPEKCRLQADAGGCAHNLPKYFFDLRLGKCLPFLWGGCEGNDNRFETFNDCQKACTIPAIRANLTRPSRDDAENEYETPMSKDEICTQPAHPGHADCSEAQQVVRYYYDAQSERCLSFAYRGCDGNKNNFASPEKCTVFCYGVRIQRNDDNILIDPRRPSPRERCPPDNCGVQDCRGLGERREVLANGCTRCVCKHPCDEVRCGPGDKCAVQYSQRSYIGICRPTNKPGQCPRASCTDGKDRGKNYCVDDSSCDGLKKCCNTGCNLACTAPQNEETNVEEVVVIEGGEASLTCPLEKAEGSLQWTKNGVDVEGDRFDQEGATLRITGVTAKDAGIYDCAEGENPSNSGKIALRIAAAPKIIKENPVVESVPAATANLSCTVVGGFPRPSIIWSRNDTTLPVRSNKYKRLPENTLQILDVDPTDQDLYLCTAANDQGRAQFMVALIIPVQGQDDHQLKGEELASKARADARNP